MGVPEALGFFMLASMVVVIFVGLPISFTLLFLALIVGGFGLGWEQTFNLAYLQIWGTMKDEIFPAVPLFIFMGYMTEQAGLMERLFGALRSLLAPVRGSLYLAVILTATIFAMATGIVGAAVTVLGIMAAPMMLKSQYDARLSAGAIAAGGTLGILVPPSVMLVVMGPVMGVPVNLLYSAAFGPGFLLAGSYVGYTLLRSFINPKLGPAMTMDERKAAYDAMTTEKVRAPVVGLGLVCLVLMVYLMADAALDRLGVPPLAVGVGPLAVSSLALVPAVATAYPYVRSRYFRAIVLGIAPLSALIGFTLGTIIGGLATPTEAASCGAFGASLLGLVYGRLDVK
ncbi:MAG: TRAP transporter large permease subunit, partial [Candidatus Rokuibacteriota bacterium]